MDLVAALPPDLLQRALTHSSWVGERTGSYERLEFLGDSVLGLAIASRSVQPLPRTGRGRAGPPEGLRGQPGELRAGGRADGPGHSGARARAGFGAQAPRGRRAAPACWATCSRRSSALSTCSTASSGRGRPSSRSVRGADPVRGHRPRGPQDGAAGTARAPRAAAGVPSGGRDRAGPRPGVHVGGGRSTARCGAGA